MFNFHIPTSITMLRYLLKVYNEENGWVPNMEKNSLLAIIASAIMKFGYCL